MPTNMSSHDRVVAVLQHRPPGVIPYYEVFMDSSAERKFLGDLLGLSPLERNLRTAEALDNDIVGVSADFFRSKLVEQRENHEVRRSEIGTVVRQQFRPSFETRLEYPIEREEDLERFRLPDPDEPERYSAAKEALPLFLDRGYFIQGRIGGFYTGVWYHLRAVEAFWEDLAIRPAFAERLLTTVGEFNLRVAENLLKLGAHCIQISEDMGMTAGPFFSPAMYRRFFFPWHQRLADLCHSHNGYFHMHSHGNIMPLLDAIVETGVDILNPVGPGDNMDLRQLKERYGHRLVLYGGLSKFIESMNRRQIENHIVEVMEIGTQGGGFMPRNESGIPESFSHEDYRWYVDTLRLYRERYGDRGATKEPS